MDKLQECANFFIQGGPTEWIGGGALLVVLVIFACIKQSIPGMLKNLPDWIKQAYSFFKSKK